MYDGSLLNIYLLFWVENLPRQILYGYCWVLNDVDRSMSHVIEF